MYTYASIHILVGVYIYNMRYKHIHTCIYIYIQMDCMYTFPKNSPMKHHHRSPLAKSSFILALQGRYFVALSLEEGQHLRAAIHRLSLDQAVGIFLITRMLC